MLKILKRIGKPLVILLGLLLIFLLATTIYHHVSLGIETKKIVPNGKLVEVDGHKIHVYAEGEKGSRPTLVFMSGSATIAPVYNFKSLYSILSDEYRIAVIEKTGYGYSEILDLPRDINTMLNEVRQGLQLAGESGPFVLFPHSMSGLEAIYWAQQYPDEVTAIIGLDMAVPECYEYMDFTSINRRMNIGHVTTWLGLHRIFGVSSLDDTSLTEYEIDQQKLLMYRNAVNIDYILEGKEVYNNAITVKSGDDLDLPVLMFVSNGIEIGEYWIPCQKRFASQNNAQLIQLDCGHYVHNFEYEFIAAKVLKFLSALQ